MQDAILKDIRVIDLTHFTAGPYCTKLMAGFGADVIKVELPGSGDKMRSMGPFFENRENPETSIPFLWLNTGKKSITLNLKSSRGKDVFKELIGQADFVVENFSPRFMSALGLSYETLSSINPHLIMVSISNFGNSGPYRDYKADEMELQAVSGLMHLTGAAQKSPLCSGPLLCQYSAGQHAYLAALMALFQRETTGKGQHIDISIQECSLENIEISLTRCLQTGQGSKRGPHMMVPWGTYECLDGYATVIAMPYRHWHHAVDLFKEPALYQEKFATPRERIKHREEYESLLRPCVKAYKKKELFNRGQKMDLAFGYVAGLDEFMQSPQHQAKGYFVDIDHPVVGEQKYCNAPFLSSQTGWKLAPAPLLGGSNSAVYGELLGYSEKEIELLAEQGVI